MAMEAKAAPGPTATMTERTSLTLTDERRRLEDRCREYLTDELPSQQFRAPLYDMALTHLLDTLRKADEGDVGSVPHEYRKQFNTRVVKYRTDAYHETRRP